ncbi:MAG: hypothetical protein WCI00_06265 [bacterium]
MSGFFLTINILHNQTHIASKITKDKATINVPIFAHHTTDKYARLNPKNIIPTSLTSPSGLYSTTVDTRLIQNNMKEIFFTNNNVCIFTSVKLV